MPDTRVGPEAQVLPEAQEAARPADPVAGQPRTVTKRELNHNMAAILAQVQPGDPVVVSERGTPRWQIVAYQPQLSGLARLKAAGQYTPPRGRQGRDWATRPGERWYTSAEIDAIIEEMKGNH